MYEISVEGRREVRESPIMDEIFTFLWRAVEEKKTEHFKEIMNFLKKGQGGEKRRINRILETEGGFNT